MLDRSDCESRGCKHYKGVTDAPEVATSDQQAQSHFCDAFPQGIPDSIAYGPNPHKTAYPGDHGIRFEKA